MFSFFFIFTHADINNVGNGVKKSQTITAKNQKPKKKGRALVKMHKSKFKSVENVQLGEIVLCKMRGFCEWPARVTGFENTQIAVQFFGDNTTHRAAIHNFYKFEESSDIILANLQGRKNPLYWKSIREAELALGIPSSHSITNRF